jgi:dolichol kinase
VLEVSADPAPAQPYALDAAVPVPHAVRPTNLVRSAFHVASGGVALAALRLLPGRGWVVAVASAFAVAAWTMEISRRRSVAVNERLMRLFGPVAHPSERHRVNSSTWFVTALLLLGAFAPSSAAEVGVLVLALADPAAGLVGRRFGRTRLRAGRSLEGTLAFLGVAALASFAWLSGAGGLATSSALILAVAGGSVGAVTELASIRLDDNFTIPVSVALAVATAQILLPVG